MTETTLKMKPAIYNFLKNLRKSGKINMLEAAPYIRDSFDIPIKEAKELLLLWFEEYKEED